VLALSAVRSTTGRKKGIPKGHERKKNLQRGSLEEGAGTNSKKKKAVAGRLVEDAMKSKSKAKKHLPGPIEQ